jgi:hypothetical protein
MSRSARLLAAALALAALPPAAAEIVQGQAKAPAGPAISPPREDLPAAVNQRTGTEAPTLRCWQEGRLVLEQGGVNFAEAPAGAHVFRRTGRNGQPVYLFDMKHGLCVLSHEPVSSPESLK